jgi:cobalamin biosynthesis Mg chelatase CobN
MDMNNPLQQRTGQVAPSAENPQNNPAQSYQQSTDQLQQTSSQLLEGANGVKIVVPTSTSAKSVKTTETVNQSSHTGVFVVGLLVAALLAIFMVILARYFSKDNEKSSTPTANESEPEPNIDETPAPKKETVKPTQPKKAKVSKAKKKRKKKK